MANIVKSSLGPVGLDKMLVDDIGDVLITNDVSLCIVCVVVCIDEGGVPCIFFLYLVVLLVLHLNIYTHNHLYKLVY